MKRLVILISGRGSNLAAILDAKAAQHWPVQVTRVISSRSDADGLKTAALEGISTSVIDSAKFADRAAFDAALAEEIDRAGADLIVLAGFMRILTPEFCQRYSGRLLNIHPSLLPLFKGLRTHQQALEAGVKVHGCTVHSVTADLDHGPVLSQAVVPVLPNDNAARLAERVLEMEHRIYPMSVAAALSGRCVLRDGRWIDTLHGAFDHPFESCLAHRDLVRDDQ